MTQELEFRRIVLGLPHNMSGPSMRLATELAHLLQLDLFGLFVEEESLRGLAALPFAREFQPLGGGWRPFNIEQLSRDLEIAGKNAGRAFAEAAKTLQTACRFEVVKGSMAETIASISRASDIVLISEPEGVADRVTAQFLSIFDAALHSAASVLLVPGRVVRHSGAIVAVAIEPDDPSIEVAKAVAAAAKAELIVVEAFKSTGRDDAPIGDPSTRVLSTLLEIGAVLRNVQERLIVTSRSDEWPPPAIASLRRVPILIIERERGKFEVGQFTKSAA